MNTTYPVQNMTPCNLNDPIYTVGSGNTASADDITSYCVDTTQYDSIKIDTSMLDDTLVIDGGAAITNFDDITFYDDTWPHGSKVYVDPAVAHGELPPPGIKNPCARKYKEDESIEALKNYISTTYGGHYTSKENNVQTLDLIESVGDAESFCRSNAIKYLSRYDKKGQAKRDILKALHYSLLLYHFSGQLNETPTRGYETF